MYHRLRGKGPADQIRRDHRQHNGAHRQRVVHGEHHSGTEHRRRQRRGGDQEFQSVRRVKGQLLPQPHLGEQIQQRRRQHAVNGDDDDQRGDVAPEQRLIHLLEVQAPQIRLCVGVEHPPVMEGKHAAEAAHQRQEAIINAVQHAQLLRADAGQQTQPHQQCAELPAAEDVPRQEAQRQQHDPKAQDMVAPAEKQRQRRDDHHQQRVDVGQGQTQHQRVGEYGHAGLKEEQRPHDHRDKPRGHAVKHTGSQQHLRGIADTHRADQPIDRGVIDPVQLIAQHLDTFHHTLSTS